MPSFTSITTPLGHISMVPRGNYSSSVTYNRLDLVTEQNNDKIVGLYIAKQDNFSNEPLDNTSYWMKVMQSSDLEGPRGATGRGIISISGPTIHVQNTIDTYTINYNDDTYSNFEVYNGKDGKDGTSVTLGAPTGTAFKLSYGNQPSVSVSTIETNNGTVFKFNFGIPEGPPGSGGGEGSGTGTNGTGISLIEKTSTSGLEDTYTIYLTDGTNYPFTVTNGEKGDPGEPGNPGRKGDTGPAGKDFHIVKTYNSEQDMQNDADNIDEGDFVTAIAENNIVKLFMKYNSNEFMYISDFSAVSIKGDTGRGIYFIEKTSTSGLEDTYTITLTDNSESTFTVTNGQNGRGIVSVSGPVVNDNINTYTINYTDNTTSEFTITNNESSNNGNPININENGDNLQFGLFESGISGEYNAILKLIKAPNSAMPSFNIQQIDNNNNNNNKSLTLLSSDGKTIIPELSLGTPLSIANGGTGLTIAPSMLVNLGTTGTANPLSAEPRPGVTGILPVNNGGIGVSGPGPDLLTNLGIHVTSIDPGLDSNLTTGHILLVYED